MSTDINNISDNQSHGQAEPTQELLRPDQIHADEDVQPRSSLKQDVIEQYAERIKAGDAFPPLDVFFDGAIYWLADGFHRLEASEEAGLESIAYSVHQGTKVDAQWFALQANKAHGLRRSSADKAKAVKAALQHPKGLKMSDGQIATHVGVSDRMVAKYREQLTPKNSESAIRTGRDGRTINTAGIGKRNNDKPAPATEPEAEAPAGAEPELAPEAGLLPAPERPAEPNTVHADNPPPSFPGRDVHKVDKDGKSEALDQDEKAKDSGLKVPGQEQDAKDSNRDASVLLDDDGLADADDEDNLEIGLSVDALNYIVGTLGQICHKCRSIADHDEVGHLPARHPFVVQVGELMSKAEDALKAVQRELQ